MGTPRKSKSGLDHPRYPKEKPKVPVTTEDRRMGTRKPKSGLDKYPKVKEKVTVTQ